MAKKVIAGLKSGEKKHMVMLIEPYKPEKSDFYRFKKRMMVYEDCLEKVKKYV